MEEESNIIVQLSPQVHNRYLSAIKKLLNASFVGWEQEKDKKQLRITVNKQNILLPFEGGDLITEDSYKDLLNKIIDVYK